MFLKNTRERERERERKKEKARAISTFVKPVGVELLTRQDSILQLFQTSPPCSNPLFSNRMQQKS